MRRRGWALVAAALALACVALALRGTGVKKALVDLVTGGERPRAEAPAEEAPAEEAEPEPVPLYAEGNVPYDFDPATDDPASPDAAAIESVVDSLMAASRSVPEDPAQLEAKRRKYAESIRPDGRSYMPTIAPYPAAGSDIGVVILPGGGYWTTSDEVEGTRIARAFNERGVTAFVVRYRVSPCDGRAILADGRRAVRWARYHAAEYGVDPDRIVVCGFSQGGHLGLMVCEHPDSDAWDADYVPDDIDAVSASPNAFIGGYPVVTLEKGHTYEVGAQVFTHGDDALREAYSAENGVRGGMCPVFIWLNGDDLLVPPEGARRLVEACEAAGVPCEFHVFMDGGHGCGLGEGRLCGEWMGLACNWMEQAFESEEWRVEMNSARQPSP